MFHHKGSKHLQELSQTKIIGRRRRIRKRNGTITVCHPVTLSRRHNNNMSPCDYVRCDIIIITKTICLPSEKGRQKNTSLRLFEICCLFRTMRPLNVHYFHHSLHFSFQRIFVMMTPLNILKVPGVSSQIEFDFCLKLFIHPEKNLQ